MYYTPGALCIFFFLQFKPSNQEQLCHQFPSKINPEILCNGFTNLLRFNNLPNDNISILSFSKNKITTINSSSFNDTLSSVTNIYLDNNTITNISASAFKNLPNMQVVDLSNNNLKGLDPETFSSNNELTTIDLTGNNIEVLHVNLVNKLGKLEKLILSRNPLQVCDPKTAETLRYLEAKKIETLFLLTCEDDLVGYEPEVPPETTPKFDGVISIVAEKNDLVDKYLPLMAILCGMVLLAIGLGYIIGRLCLKLPSRTSPDHGRTRTVSGKYLLPGENQRLSTASGEDENGYLVPTNPSDPPRYIEVIGDVNEAPLISLNSEVDLARIRSFVEIPVPHGREITNPLNHVYEEIQERGSFYERNLQRHLAQSYSRVKIAHSK